MKKWSLSGAEAHIFSWYFLFNFTNVSAPLNDRKVVWHRSVTEMKKWSLSGAEAHIFSWYYIFNFTNVSAPLNDRKVILSFLTLRLRSVTEMKGSAQRPKFAQ
jgi:hypothetical protein